ncbi:MAG TPA: FCD domain-containing protein, partial [Bryobacteraceae bacterium]|nr:FCD domain-containing protein [Bryobacteraceae bacterium]
MRGVLEGTAARLAAERLLDSRELEPLRRYCDEMGSTDLADIERPTIDGFARYMDLNEAFHSTIVDLAKSPILKQTIERVTSLPFAAPSAVVFANSKLPNAAARFAIGEEHHHAIVEAIEHRQGTRAESVAHEHARLSRRNLEMILAQPSILSCLPGASLIRLPKAI